MDILPIFIWFSGVAFVYFGLNCFFSQFIKSEFERYSLPSFRKLTGVLQLCGAFGLLIGLYYNTILLFLASTGLFLLMLGGFIVRIKIKDSFTQSFPSFGFAVINLFIAIKTLLTYF
ncbi:DoxX family protein [Flavobacteriaceae bacterium]|nr:DoxX family protein [Flavobacteriaceae bacterium]MDA9585020.1 DoxX family protein [Flavobacteriaceae bacterium]